jgi:hypothetical protein
VVLYDYLVLYSLHMAGCMGRLLGHKLMVAINIIFIATIVYLEVSNDFHEIPLSTFPCKSLMAGWYKRLS